MNTLQQILKKKSDNPKVGKDIFDFKYPLAFSSQGVFKVVISFLYETQAN